MIYLAFYKHKKKIHNLKTLCYAAIDGLTRISTRGKYSHCEIAISRPDGQYNCYSASVRDGGVRRKTMMLPPGKWDLIEVTCNIKQVTDYFEKTCAMSYDFWGAGGVVLPIKEDRKKAFCSEWCFNAVFNSDEGWRFSPSQLFAVVKYAKDADLKRLKTT